MVGKPGEFLLDEASLDRSLEDLLRQEKYRWCCDRTNVKQFALFVSILSIISAVLSFPTNIVGSIISILVSGFAVRALTSRGRYTSIKPAIVFYYVAVALLIVLIILTALGIVFISFTYNKDDQQKNKLSKGELVGAGIITFVFLLPLLLLELWFLKGFKKAQEFLEEAGQLRNSALARLNPV